MAVVVRQVWATNLHQEMALIASLPPSFCVAAFDTEFPGTVIDLGLSRYEIANLDSPRSYDLMRLNINATQIIQLGLAISTPHGALPNLGTNCSFIWQFNFRDFDVDSHSHAPDSIALLKKQGIDFDKNRAHGVNSSVFATLFSGLIGSRRLTWATFHGSYDFGFLVKTLTRQDMPSNFTKFMKLFGVYFGVNVYDVKHMVKGCDGLYGGLEKVAASLGVARVAGNSHQAGSDSLLTLHTFLKLEREHFRDNAGLLKKNRCILHSLGQMVFDPRFRLIPIPIPFLKPYCHPMITRPPPQVLIRMVLYFYMLVTYLVVEGYKKEHRSSNNNVAAMDFSEAVMAEKRGSEPGLVSKPR